MIRKLSVLVALVNVLAVCLAAQEPESGESPAVRGQRTAADGMQAGAARTAGNQGDQAKFNARLRELVGAGKLTRAEAGELAQLAFPTSDKPQGRSRRFEVKDPAEFNKLQEEPIFSGPQVGESVSEFKAIGLGGKSDGEEFDPLGDADGKPLLLLFQDTSGVGMRGVAGWAQVMSAIRTQSDIDFDVSVIFLGDDPAALIDSTRGLRNFLGDKIQMAFSGDGRDGPGQLGLNRNVGLTALLVKDGKVLHNFAFTQPQLTPEPHVLGGLAELLGIERETLSQWLNGSEATQDRMRMQRR